MNNLITFIVLLIICVICVYATDLDNFPGNSTEIEAKSSGDVEGRRRKVGHYFYHPHHGWYALSILYWVKVKLIVIAFFVGTAFVWSINYIAKFYRTCPGEGHIHYGHYRSFEDPVVTKFLQNLK